MSKELNIRTDVPQALRTAMEALPDPGLGKKLIMFVSASTIRLRISEEAPTIEEQESGSGGGGQPNPQ